MCSTIICTLCCTLCGWWASKRSKTERLATHTKSPRLWTHVKQAQLRNMKQKTLFLLSCLFKIIGAIPNAINLWCWMSKDKEAWISMSNATCKFDEIIAACTLLTSSCFHNALGPNAIGINANTRAKSKRRLELWGPSPTFSYWMHVGGLRLSLVCVFLLSFFPLCSSVRKVI